MKTTIERRHPPSQIMLENIPLNGRKLPFVGGFTIVFLVVKKTKKLTEKFDISLRKFKKIESPKMVQKNGPENEVLAPEKAQTAVKKVEDCGNRTLLPQLWGALTVPFNRG